MIPEMARGGLSAAFMRSWCGDPVFELNFRSADFNVKPTGWLLTAGFFFDVRMKQFDVTMKLPVVQPVCGDARELPVSGQTAEDGKF